MYFISFIILTVLSSGVLISPHLQMVGAESPRRSIAAEKTRGGSPHILMGGESGALLYAIHCAWARSRVNHLAGKQRVQNPWRNQRREKNGGAYHYSDVGTG